MTLCTVYKTSSSAYSPDEAECFQCSLKGCSICFTLIVAYLAVMFKKGNMLKIWTQLSGSNPHQLMDTSGSVQKLTHISHSIYVKQLRLKCGRLPLNRGLRSMMNIHSQLHPLIELPRRARTHFWTVCERMWPCWNRARPPTPHVPNFTHWRTDKTHQTHHVDSDQFLFPCK